jgi:PST family polysaccharide transporter
MSDSSNSVAELASIDKIGGASDPLQSDKIRRDSVRGGFISISSGFLSVAIRLVSTIVLARTLTAADFGIVAMVTAVTAFVALFRDMGLSSATIQKQDLSRGQQSNLFWINVATGAALTAITLVLAPAIAFFYGRPELLGVTSAISLTFLISSFSAQPYAALTRELQFGRLAISDLSGAFATLLTTLSLAMSGMGYWALVWGGLIGTVVTTLSTLYLSPFKPGLWDKGSSISDMVRFGANITIFGIANFFHLNFDNIAIGYTFGPIALGQYSRAYSLLMTPVQALRSPVSAICYPTFCRLLSEPSTYKSSALRITSLVSLFSIPLFTFTLTHSNLVTTVLLGPGWEVSGECMRGLSLAGMVLPILNIASQILLSHGNSQRYRNWGLAYCSLMTAAIAAGLPFGVQGVATAYGIATVLLFTPSLLYSTVGTCVSSSDMLRAVVPAIAASTMAICATLLIVPATNFNLSTAILTAATFCLFYCSMVLSISNSRTTLQWLLRQLRAHLFSRRRLTT